jgi:hypothetical protein
MSRYCPKCYVGIDPEDVICKNCGTVLKPEMVDENGQIIGASQEAETVEEPEAEAPGAQMTEDLKALDTEGGFVEEPKAAPVQKAADADKDQAPVMSLGEWVLTLLLTFIPVVNIVMLIIWAASSDTNPSKQGFARARLIWMAVGIVISLIIFFSFFSALMAYGGMAGYY